MATIHICTSSDNNYIQHAGVMITSVLKNSNHDEHFIFHILDGGIKESEKKKINKLKKIKEFEINYYLTNNDDFKDCPVHYLTIATYYRFKIQTYLKDVDKVLYLDCDTIVNANLKELWDTNIDNYWVAGVEDPISGKNKERLGIPSEHLYFNAGVLLINLKKWREDNIQGALFDYVSKYPEKIKWVDQDVLNDVLHEKSYQLPLKWNSMYYPYENSTYSNKLEYEEALKNPCIIHYIMADKPWTYGSKVPRKIYYFRNAIYTPWSVSFISKYLINCIGGIPKHITSTIPKLLKFIARHPFFFLFKKKRELFIGLFK